MIRSALFQRVVEHWHAVVIGRPADRGSASRDQALSASASRAHDKDPPLISRFHDSQSRRERVSAGFDSGRGDCGDQNGMGEPAAGEPVDLFLPANTARHHVGISVGIGSNTRRNLLEIQMVIGLDGYRPGAPRKKH
jgi:hypothetical protein